MARMYCTASQHAHRHRNAGIYLHLWTPEVQHDSRLRLCPTHLTMFENDLAQYELLPLDDATSVLDPPTDCFACRKPVDKTDWHLSLTAYPAKDQRKDYWARLHTNCRLPEWAQNGDPLQT